MTKTEIRKHIVDFVDLLDDADDSGRGPCTERTEAVDVLIEFCKYLKIPLWYVYFIWENGNEYKKYTYTFLTETDADNAMFVEGNAYEKAPIGPCTSIKKEFK